MTNKLAGKYLKSRAPEIFQGEVDASEDKFTELEDLENPILELYALWQSSAAVRCLRLAFAVLQVCPPNAPPGLVADLIECLEDCERRVMGWRKQLPGLREAAEAEPCNGDAQAAPAFALDALDEREEAIKFYRRALHNSTSLCHWNYRDCLNNVGWDLYMRGQYEDALVWFEQACWLRPAADESSDCSEVEPPYKLALENMLLCLAKLGRLTDATKRLKIYFEHFGQLARYETEALRKLGLDTDVAYIRDRIEQRSNPQG